MANVVPKRGQRCKSVILPPFNRGRAFRIVEVNGRMGIVDEKKEGLHVWLETDICSSRVADTDVVQEFVVPLPNQFAYEAESSIIGGVGKTVRWNVVLPRKRQKTTSVLFVLNIRDVDEFANFMRAEIEPFAFVSSEYSWLEEENCFCVRVSVPDNNEVGVVAAKIHAQNYGAALDTDECQGKLGIERLDRSDHMWWNQDSKKAGPLRDTHRWKYPWCKWAYLPFNWHMMAQNFDVSLMTCRALPLPLRNYVVDMKINTASCEKYKAAAQRLKSKIHCVTARLSDEQNTQLLKATYYMLIAPFDEKIKHACHLLQFRYCLHGFIGREVGGYRQDAKHLGHGAYIRPFKNKDQYKPENLSQEVLNKVFRPDGTFLGTGFKGTRGKHSHLSENRYKPQARMKRTLATEMSMRASTKDVFDEYRTYVDDKRQRTVVRNEGVC